MALKQATRAIDLRFKSYFFGEKYDEDQALQWPKTSIYDWGSLLLAEGTIPGVLEDATAEAAIRYIVANPSGVTGENPLIPDVESRSLKSHTVTTEHKSERWEWTGSGGTKSEPEQGSTIDLSIVELLLSDFMHSGPSVGRA